MTVMLQAFTYLIAFVCTFSTLKFMKLLRFNKRMAMLASTLRYAAGPLASFLVMFMVLFMAFVLASYIIFGNDLADFSSFANSMATLFSAMLSKYIGHVTGLPDSHQRFPDGST